MDCAGKGSRRRCTGPATRRCNRCQAVSYCSITHQVLYLQPKPNCYSFEIDVKFDKIWKKVGKKNERVIFLFFFLILN